MHRSVQVMIHRATCFHMYNNFLIVLFMLMQNKWNYKLIMKSYPSSTCKINCYLYAYRSTDFFHHTPHPPNKRQNGKEKNRKGNTSNNNNNANALILRWGCCMNQEIISYDYPQRSPTIHFYLVLHAPANPYLCTIFDSLHPTYLWSSSTSS